jgi:hypothetical protein
MVKEEAQQVQVRRAQMATSHPMPARRRIHGYIGGAPDSSANLRFASSGDLKFRCSAAACRNSHRDFRPNDVARDGPGRPVNELVWAGELSDEMTRILEEAGEGLKALEEEVITTQFDPDDPVSVQAAIDHVEHAIDAKIAPYRGNRLVEEAVDQIKAECRTNILQQVADHNTNRRSRTVH